MKRLRLLGLLAIPFMALAGCGTQEEPINVDALACEEKLNTTINELDTCLQATLVTVDTGVAIPSTDTNTGTDTNTTTNTISSSTEDTLRTHVMFPPQPQVPVGNYSGNSKQLNNYAHNSMRSIMVPDSYNKITIEFIKPVASQGRNFILYIA